MNKIGVLVIDDSAMVRQVISELLVSDPAIAVIAAVADPIFAMARMRIQWPDVVVLDTAVKRMDGLTFLRKIMAERPTAVVVCATPADADALAEVRAAGAFSVIAKPPCGLKRFLEESAAQLISAVKSAALADMIALKSALPVRRASSPVGAAAPVARKNSADVITAPPAQQSRIQSTDRIIALGTSTGGTQALERLLTALPRDCPGIAVVQHMPETFTAAFAERLLPGHVLIAPGGKHLMLRRSGGCYYAEVVDGPAVNRHKPSVDVLFRSVAKCAGPNALGAIMTGMGDDGARGLLEMRQAGSATVAQDEASCVVFGMPKEAIKLGAVERVMPLRLISQALIDWGEGAPVLTMAVAT